MNAEPLIHAVAWIAAVLAPVCFIVGFLLLPRARRSLRWAALFLAAPYLIGVWAFLIEPKLLFVRQVEIAPERWSGPPLRIGVITDTHVGVSNVSPARMRAIVQRMNAEKPDIVVLLGDYAPFHEPAAVRAAPARSIVQQGIAAFAGLEAPKGVYGVIGNHDVWYDIDAIRVALQRANVTVLEDHASPISNSEAWLVGLNEYSERKPDYHRAIAAAPDDAPLIVIMHWPDSVDGIYDVAGRAVLSLAGHTHCGQMGVPLLNQLVVASPASRAYRCGLYNANGKLLYVSGGVGTSVLPMRFFAPPEIGIVTIRAR